MDPSYEPKMENNYYNETTNESQHQKRKYSYKNTKLRQRKLCKIT